MKVGIRFRTLAAAMLAVVLVGACSTFMTGSTVTYSFDPRFGFAEVKTYRWAEARSVAMYGDDPLLEANVRFLTDRALELGGLKPSAGKVDLVASIGYEFSSYRHELRTLTVSLSRADNDALVWRGLATGAIKTDAASGELKAAVDGMFANFPPKN